MEKNCKTCKHRIGTKCKKLKKYTNDYDCCSGYKSKENNSSERQVDAMVISQKERTTLWYLYDKKRGHFVYHHLDEGWDDAGRPKCHTEGNRWAKEIAWKDKSEIAAFKVSYSEI